MLRVPFAIKRSLWLKVFGIHTLLKNPNQKTINHHISNASGWNNEYLGEYVYVYEKVWGMICVEGFNERGRDKIDGKKGVNKVTNGYCELRILVRKIFQI